MFGFSFLCNFKTIYQLPIIAIETPVLSTEIEMGSPILVVRQLFQRWQVSEVSKILERF